MKKFLSLVLLFACLCANAADHIISWAPNPADQFIMGYCVYEQVAGVWQKRADVPGSINTVTLSGVSSGLHVYSMSATNAFGESTKSASINAIVPSIPSPPTNIIVNLRASIESAPSALGPWSEFSVIEFPIEKTQNLAFYRVKQELH